MKDLLNITGERIIWRHDTIERTFYTTTLSSTVNNETIKTNIEVKFPRDTYLDNGQTIIIKKGFLSCYRNNNYVLQHKVTNQKLVYNQIYIVVSDYDVIGEPIVPNFATKKVD